LVSAQQPEAAGWIAPLVRAAPVAYLMLIFKVISAFMLHSKGD
jgi:hypothetical protein